ncbi:MAG: dipeptide ABC transporter ATP-binding protein [Elusimicrobiota bacterium]
MTPLLEVRGLKKHYAVESDRLFEGKKTVKAVDGLSFKVYPGDTFGLVGESGCGKSTLGRTVLALETPTAGEVRIEGRDIFALSAGELRRLRREIQVIFQDPYSSLNPRMTVEQIVAEPMIIHGLEKDPAKRRARVAELLDLVGLAQGHIDRHPHMFSGGQRQRIGIARALSLNPKLIVCDEPVSALDVSIQAQILNLLQDLQQELNLTYLFIAHDFSVVRHLCNRVGVMYLGRIVETAETEALFDDPQHPYTEALLSAVPVPDPIIERKRHRVLLTGDVPSPIEPPAGCHFHPRCNYRRDDCRTVEPALTEVRAGHSAACPVLPFKDAPSKAALKGV